MTELDRPLYDTPRRYWIDPPSLRGTGERLPEWRCQCKRPDGRPLLRKYRHVEPWRCLSDMDVAAFVAANPGAPPRKHLAWMEREFGGKR